MRRHPRPPKIEQLGSYRILRRLGQGAAGYVFEAVEVEEQVPVALKVFVGILDPLGRERFVQEARLASRVRHPNLVTIYDCGEVDGKLYIAYELMADRDLDEVLQDEGNLAPPRAVEAIGQVGTGLAALHREGILHRDVKPANMYRRPDGTEWVLGDLGVAKDTTGHSLRTASGILMGTPEYIAPETMYAEQIDARADQYSLGVVLYELLTGHLPVDAETPEEAFRRKCDTALDPEVLPASEELRKLVGRMLAPEPDERFETLDAVMEAMEALPDLSDLPHLPPEQCRPRHARDTVGRRRGGSVPRHQTRMVSRDMPVPSVSPPPLVVSLLAVAVATLAWLLF